MTGTEAVLEPGILAPETSPAATAPASPAVTNGLWNALSSGAVAVVGLISSVVLVRSLSARDYGVLSYYLWLAGLCASVGLLAFAPSLTKVGAELRGAGQPDTAEALGRWVLRLQGALNAVLAAGLLLATIWHKQDAVLLVIVAALQVPTACSSVLSSRFWSRQHFRPVSAWTLTAAVAQLLLTLLAVTRHLGLPGLLLAVLSPSIVTWLGLAWQTRRTQSHEAPVRVVPTSLPASVRQHYLAFLAPASLAILFETVVWQRSELYFINRLGDPVPLGHYSLAYTIFSIFLSIGWALITSYLPAMASDYGTGDRTQMQRRLQQGATLAAVYAVPVSGGAVVVLGTVVELLYGPKMAGAVPVGQVLLLSLVPSVLAGLLSLSLNAAGGIWWNVTLGLGVAGVNITLDMLLIPRLGAIGGAIATAIAQTLYLLGLLALMRRRLGLGLGWRGLALILAAGVGSTFLTPLLLVRALPGLPGLLAAVLVGGGLYLALLWRLGVLAELRKAA